jgi:hypothetical protein
MSKRILRLARSKNHFFAVKFADNEGSWWHNLGFCLFLCCATAEFSEWLCSVLGQSPTIKTDLKWNLFAHCKGRRVAEGQRRADSQFAVLSARHSASKWPALILSLQSCSTRSRAFRSRLSCARICADKCCSSRLLLSIRALSWNR